LAIVVQQGRRINQLESAFNESEVRGPLAEGMAVPGFKVKDLAGQEQEFQFARTRQKPLLIYVFKPSCKWCQLNTNNFNGLADQIQQRYETIGLSLDAENLPEYLQEHPLKAKIYTGVSGDMRSSYHLGSTPETIVVSVNGVVIKSWVGTYGNPLLRPVIERFFSARVIAPRVSD